MNGTRNDFLTIGAEHLKDLLTFVDVSFAVHEDMRSHTNGCVSFGTGFFMTRSTKQKMNSTSTTESEVIGAAEYLPNTIWLLQFLKAQGYNPTHRPLYQDNESAIRLEKYGKRSSSRRSRHFDIKLFNIKDKLRDNDIDVTYCPTDKMVADFFTKPLQGSQFRLMRDVILGRTPLSNLNLHTLDTPCRDKERVGDKIDVERKSDDQKNDPVIKAQDERNKSYLQALMGEVRKT